MTELNNEISRAFDKGQEVIIKQLGVPVPHMTGWANEINSNIRAVVQNLNSIEGWFGALGHIGSEHLDDYYGQLNHFIGQIYLAFAYLKGELVHKAGAVRKFQSMAIVQLVSAKL